MKTKPVITCTRKYEILRIFINDHLHVQLKLQDMIGLQSWVHGEKEFYIEYYFSNGAPITTAYGERELWEQVLALLLKHQ